MKKFLTRPEVLLVNFVLLLLGLVFLLSRCTVTARADESEVWVRTGGTNLSPGFRVYVQGIKSGHTLQRIDAHYGEELRHDGWRPLYPQEYTVISNRWVEFKSPEKDVWCYVMITDNPPILRRSTATGGRFKFAWRHYPEIQSLYCAPIGSTNWQPFPMKYPYQEEVTFFDATNNWIYAPVSMATNYQWKLVPGWPRYFDGIDITTHDASRPQ